LYPCSKRSLSRCNLTFLRYQWESYSKTPEEIKNKINLTVCGAVEFAILDPPPTRNGAKAISQGKTKGATFCIYGGNDATTDGPETTINVLLVNSSQYNQLIEITNKILFKNDKNEIRSSKVQTGMLMLSSYPYVKNPIKLNPPEIIPDSVYTICALARYAEHRYDGAISFFENITNYKNNTNILFYIGNCYLFQYKFDEARKTYDEPININPLNSIAWGSKRIALYDLNQSDETIKAFNDITKNNQKNSDAWYNKGIILNKLYKSDETIKAYDKAIELIRRIQTPGTIVRVFILSPIKKNNQYPI
jgi:tetratricopeptide (TPR) repeat protein